MRKTLLVAGVLIVLAALALPVGLSRFHGLVEQFPRPATGDTVTIGGQLWRKAFGWDFARGACPGGWGWGEWRLRRGVLQGHGVEGLDAVYVCPFEHGGDFLLETEVRLVRGEGGRSAEAHLLTRDGAELHHESGVALFGGESRINVRHMENRQEHLSRIVPIAAPLAYGQWHRLQFAVRGGRVSVRMDGALLFESDDTWPTGLYREPHLAARSGVAQFRCLNIYTLP